MSEKANNEMFDKSAKFNFMFGLVSGVAIMAIIVFTLLFFLLLSGKNLAPGTAAPVAANNAAVAQPTPQAAPEAPTPSIVDVRPIDETDNTKGSADAKVQIVEYSDFECPFCQRFAPTLGQLEAKYGDSIQIAYRHFPLTNIHASAKKAAEASECAADQGKFWEMHDGIFALPSLSVDAFKKVAQDGGFDVNKFNTCLDSGEKSAKVDAHYTEGIAIGVQGTPTVIVNGRLFPGAASIAELSAYIDAELAK